MKRLIALVAMLVAGPVIAGEWGEITESFGQRNLEISSSQKKLSLVWHDAVIPGAQLLFVKNTGPGATFYSAYEFLGIAGGSAQVKETIGAVYAPKVKGAPAGGSDKSDQRVILIECDSGGVFYFVPEDMKYEAYFRVERDKTRPGFYMVSIVKRAGQ